MEDKLRYMVEQEIEVLKGKFGEAGETCAGTSVGSDGTFDEYHLGLLKGFYSVLSFMRQIEYEATVTKNIHDIDLRGYQDQKG